MLASTIMNRHRLLLFVMAVASFVLLWGGELPCVFGAPAGTAWAKQTPNVTPGTILSPGREVRPISLELSTGEDPWEISRPEPKASTTPRAADHRSVVHISNEAGKSSIPQAPAARPAPAGEKKSFEFKDGLLTLEANQRPISELLGQISAAAGVEIVIFDPIDSGTISVSIKDRPVEETLRTILKGCSYSVVYNPKREDQGVRIVQQPNTHSPRSGQNALPALAMSSASTRSATARGPEGQSAAAGASSWKAAGKGDSSVRVALGSAAGSSAGAGGPYNRSESQTETTSPQHKALFRVAENVSAGNTQSGSMTSEQKLQRLISMYEQRIASGISDREYERNLEISGGAYPIQHDEDILQFYKSALKEY
jgi:hypothetical protein